VVAANYAATDGSATLASTFNNTAPNGTWSLYAMANSANGAATIGGGWCLNITPQVQTTITTSPANLMVSVDNGTFTAAPLVENWTVGSSHTIATSSPQAGTTGVQYVWSSWSDGSAISHSITVPSTATTYTATFNTQYQLMTNVSPSGAGSVSPPSGGFYNAGSTQKVSANANPGYAFANWTVNVANPSAPSTTVTMNAPQTVTANFTELKTRLSAALVRHSGPLNARAWTFSLLNSGPGAANAAQINGFTLTQSGGPACKPVVITAFPLPVGNIAPASGASAVITINFDSCKPSPTTKFTAKLTYAANSGAVTGTSTFYHVSP
jgi:hypothetical protein